VQVPGSEIQFYINNLELLFTKQSEKLNFMKNRLSKFKQMIKEEEELSRRIVKANEMLDTFYGESIYSASNSKLEGSANTFEQD
jgi:hypothetical protein